jgi:hypothetical protein
MAHALRRDATLLKPVALLAAWHPGSILLARPLNELWAHIRDRELPSFALIARAIKTLALYIFKGQLWDHILLAKKGGIFHSLNGQLEAVTPQQLERTHPKMIRCALVLIPNIQQPEALFKDDFIDEPLGDDLFGRDAVIDPSTEMSPESVAAYYREACGIHLDPLKLTESPLLLRPETNERTIRETFQNLYGIRL